MPRNPRTEMPCQASAKDERAQVFSKTKMCRFHILGSCGKGKKCQFAHEKGDLQITPDLSRTKLCKVLIRTGACDDPECRYAHNREELRVIDGFNTTLAVAAGLKDDKDVSEKKGLSLSCMVPPPTPPIATSMQSGFDTHPLENSGRSVQKLGDHMPPSMNKPLTMSSRTISDVNVQGKQLQQHGQFGMNHQEAHQRSMQGTTPMLGQYVWPMGNGLVDQALAQLGEAARAHAAEAIRLHTIATSMGAAGVLARTDPQIALGTNSLPSAVPMHMFSPPTSTVFSNHPIDQPSTARMQGESTEPVCTGSRSDWTDLGMPVTLACDAQPLNSPPLMHREGSKRSNVFSSCEPVQISPESLVSLSRQASKNTLASDAEDDLTPVGGNGFQVGGCVRQLPIQPVRGCMTNPEEPWKGPDTFLDFCDSPVNLNFVVEKVHADGRTDNFSASSPSERSPSELFGMVPEDEPLSWQSTQDTDVEEESAKHCTSPTYARKLPIGPPPVGMHVKNTFINLASDDSPWRGMRSVHTAAGCLNLMAVESDENLLSRDADDNRLGASTYFKKMPIESPRCNVHVKNTFIDFASDDSPWMGLRSVQTTAGCLNLMSMEDDNNSY